MHIAFGCDVKPVYPKLLALLQASSILRTLVTRPRPVSTRSRHWQGVSGRLCNIQQQKICAIPLSQAQELFVLQDHFILRASTNKRESSKFVVRKGVRRGNDKGRPSQEVPKLPPPPPPPAPKREPVAVKQADAQQAMFANQLHDAQRIEDLFEVSLAGHIQCRASSPVPALEEKYVALVKHLSPSNAYSCSCGILRQPYQLI